MTMNGEPGERWSFGECLKSLRSRRGMTQRQLAGETKLSESFLSDLENGKRLPSALTLRVLADEFRVTMGWMFSGRN